MNDEICDEEKSFHVWLSNNLKYVSQHKESIMVMKKLYMEGFAAGFHHKHIILAAEQLQK
jgi:hypothetical protein